MSIIIEVNNQLIEIRNLRDANNGFENALQYANAVLLPILSAMPSAVTIRCKDSGIPVGYITASELQDCVKAAVEDTKFTRFNDLLKPYTEYDFKFSVEAIIDQVEIKMILTRIQSPSFAFVHGEQREYVASPAKQLCLLLNQFLFDPQHVSHNRYQDVSVEIADARRLAVMADEILEYFQLESEIALKCLHSLIELDAKYRINKITYRNEEIEILNEIKHSANNLNAEQLLIRIYELVELMLTWRDEFSTTYPDRPRWTNKAFYVNMTQYERESRIRSNVLTAPVKLKTPEQRVKEQKAAEIKDEILSAFRGMK